MRVNSQYVSTFATIIKTAEHMEQISIETDNQLQLELPTIIHGEDKLQGEN